MIAVGADPESGRSAVLVFEHIGAGQDQRLPRIVLRHFDAARLESLLDRLEARVIEDQLTLQNARNDFLGDVVFRGPQPADGDDDRRSFKASSQRLFQIALIVADNGFHDD